MQPELACAMLGHQAEHHHPVGHRQGVGVVEVELVLAVTALVVERVEPPAELGHVLGHRVEEVLGEDRRLEVIAAGRLVEAVAGDQRLPAVFGWPDHVELGLDADIGYEAHVGRSLHLLQQHVARVLQYSSPSSFNVDGASAICRSHGNTTRRSRSGKPWHSSSCGSQFAHSFQCAHGVELRAVRHRLQGRHRNALALRYAMDVDVETEDVPHSLIGKCLAQLGG